MFGSIRPHGTVTMKVIHGNQVPLWKRLIDKLKVVNKDDNNK